MDRLGGDAGPDQAAHDLVGAVLGAGEDQRAVDRLAPQHVDQDRGLSARSTRMTRCSTRSTVDATGVTATLTGSRSICAGELGDGARHGRGEQQRLPLRRKLGDDLADVVDEAHVEHAVGFVEHEEFDVAEAKRVALHEVEQPARRGDEDVDAVEQRAHLAAHRHAADRQRRRGCAGGGHRCGSCRGSGRTVRASG